MPNLEKIQGNIATTPSGAQVDLTTGQLIAAPPATPITPGSLQPTQPLAVTPTATPTIPDVKNLPITEPAKPEAPSIGTDLNKQLADLTSQLEGKNVTSEVKAGTVDQQRELNNINTQIRMHQARSLARQEEALKSGETLGFASGEAANVARTDAIRGMELAALAQAAQGNLSLATELTTNAVEEKYKQVIKNIETKRNNIIANYEQFNKTEKATADKLLLRLNDEDKFIKEKKKKEEAITTIGNQAAAAGAPISLVQKAIALGDVVQANALLSPYLAKKTSITEVNGRKILVNEQTGEIIKDLGEAPSTLKPPTAAQDVVATYAARLEQSNPTITELTTPINKMNPIWFEAQIRLPSFAQSANIQQYMQAARNFINATLRRESGAVISPTEFDNAYAQYLPKPKDSPATLAQKKINRDIVQASFKRGAGSAYQSIDELLGTQPGKDPLGLR